MGTFIRLNGWGKIPFCILSRRDIEYLIGYLSQGLSSVLLAPIMHVVIRRR